MLPPGGRILAKIYKIGCGYFTYLGREGANSPLYVRYQYIKLFFLETSKSKNSRTIWQHVILLLHSKWFEVRTIYFYGPFLLNQIPFPLKHPTKSRSKWGKLNKKACSGNTRKLVWGENREFWTVSNLFPVSISIHIKELRETWE